MSARSDDADCTLEFDAYNKGVLTGRLTVLPQREPTQAAWVERTYDAEPGWGVERWQAFSPETSTTGWSLPGALATLPAALNAILAADWHAVGPVELTLADGAQRRYVHNGARQADAERMAHYWALDGGGVLRDGVPPLDLLITPDGQLVAALDPGQDIVLVASGWESCTSLRWWLGDGVRQARYGVARRREMVAMSDGVRLATDVYLPLNAPGATPVILCRTPYGIDNVLPYPAHQVWMFATSGYAVVMQDVRGRGASEGVWEYIAHEPQDGDETLTWLAAQPWCDGTVGMIGGSYPGHTQWMAAMYGNPALRSMIPVVSMGTPHNDMPFIGGALNAGVCAWAYFMAGGARQRDDWAALLRERPIVGFVERGVGQPSRFWDIIMTHTLYDDYWRAIDWTLRGEQIDVPALHVSGWYDDDLPGTLANWALMERHERRNQRLILGGWRHGGNVDRAIHGVKFGPDVIREDLYVEMFRWHEHWLKGVENGVDDAACVQYFSVGDNVWKTADTWPPATAMVEAWHLRAGGDLTREAPDTETPDMYRYDPANPAPSSILRHLHLNEQNLPDDYQSIEARSDVLTYTSAVLTEPLELAGNLRMVLYAATSARDTDWIARLCDVYPDGRSMRLVEGVIRARHRNTVEREEFVTPGAIERYEIAMRAHANVFLPGHRLRLSVTSSAEGYIFPNSNTGENETTVTHSIVADQTIYHDAEHPSHVLLPIIRR